MLYLTCVNQAAIAVCSNLAVDQHVGVINRQRIQNAGAVGDDQQSAVVVFLVFFHAFGNQAHGVNVQITRSEAKSRAMDLFDKLNFKDSQRVWDSYPFELSGGMNQRAGIAIAMLMNPPILFADEPTSALDVSVQRQVVREMLKLRELFGTAIVIVTHDIGVVRAMADTVLVLKNGKTVEYGTADRVLDHPRDPYTRKLLEAVPKLQRKVRV